MDSSPYPPSLPSTILDESLLVLQETRATWNVQFELGTDHRLDEARVRQAVLTCCLGHPMARARLTQALRGGTSYRWDFVDKADPAGISCCCLPVTSSPTASVPCA